MKDTNAIALTDVQFHWAHSGFRFGIEALSVRHSERVLLLGPSGGGKSTLLGLICGISTPESGIVEVLGTDLGSLSSSRRDRFRAEHIGVIFQMFNLLPYASAVENVALGLSFAPERMRRTRENGSPTDVANHLLTALGLPEGPLRGQPASRLSTGQQQRVAAARAFIGQPEIIVADEPTSALDRGSQDRFLDLLFGQLDALGSTLFMVSHDERLAPRFDRVLHTDEILKVEVPA